MASIRDGIVVGTTPTIQASFTTTAGTPADPTTVSFVVLQPDGTEQSWSTPDPTITNTAVGVYDFIPPFPFTQVGSHWVYYSGVGNGVTVADEVEVPVSGVHVTIPIV